MRRGVNGCRKHICTGAAAAGRLVCAARAGFARDFATCLRAAGRRAVGLALVLAMVLLRPTAPRNRQFRGPTASGQRQSEAIEIKGKLVETKLSIECADFGRPDQLGVGDGNRV